MKIISWNLKNLGQTKLGNAFTPTYSAYGLGGNVGTFITNLVTGSPVWNNIANLSTNPADVFVVIELKTGGSNKGTAVGGTCIPTLTLLRNAMNQAVNARLGNNLNYLYNFAIPLVCGRHETVGVIFNTRVLNLVGFTVFRNLTNNNWINPRTPGGAQLTDIASGNNFQVIGIHAPPPKGAANIKYRPPIQYSNLLQHTTPTGLANTFFMGDFNCNPNSTYVLNAHGGPVNVGPFQNMPGFGTRLPTPTLSSVRTKITNNFPPPASYLNDAYDNIWFNTAVPVGTPQIVPDMIGNARNMNVIGTPVVFGANPATSAAIVRAFNMVSDHLPVVIEF